MLLREQYPRRRFAVGRAGRVLVYEFREQEVQTRFIAVYREQRRWHVRRETFRGSTSIRSSSHVGQRTHVLPSVGASPPTEEAEVEALLRNGAAITGSLTDSLARPRAERGCRSDRTRTDAIG